MMGGEDMPMDGLANLQPETVELPDLKDCQSMYRMEQDTSGKENDVMEIQEPISQAPIDIVLQEGIPIGIDNSKFKAENKQSDQKLKQEELNGGKSRIKERTIQEVIEKVSKWRLYYRGCQHNGVFIKLTLEEAAQRVKISKKSLDDYLMQLRSAKKFGFDFEKHSHEKVGTIRAFVRKKKEEERQRQALAKQGAAGRKTESAGGGDDSKLRNAASKAARKVVRKTREFKPKCSSTPE
jgi:hypothetical protein